jgi:hypothetical protein
MQLEHLIYSSSIIKNDKPFMKQVKIEFLTKKRRYILKPMEELQVIELGSVVMNKYNLDNSIDIEYKAGLYNLTSSFLLIFGNF